MNAFEKFVTGKEFIYVIAAYFFLIWLTGLEIIGIASAILFISYILITQRDITPILPVVILVVTCVSLKQLPISFNPYGQGALDKSQLRIFIAGGVFLTLLVGSIIFHLIKFKHEQSEDKSSKTIYFIAAAVAMFLGGLFSNQKYYPLSHVISLFYFGLLAFYLLCRHANPRGDKKEYFATLSIVFAVVICLSMTVFYIKQESFIDALIDKSLFVGYGATNTLAPILVVAVPMALYLYVKTQKLPYIIIGLIIYVGVFFTVCRGEIFLLVIFTPLLAVLLIKFSKKKLEPLIVALIFLTAAVMAYFIFNNFFKEFIERISYFSNSGRTPLRIRFSKFFADNPIFGIGYIIDKDGKGVLAMPHMVVTNILSSTGIVGFFAFIALFFNMFKAVFVYKSRYNLFFAISLFLIFGYSFADPMFYEVLLFFSVMPLLQGSYRDTQKPRYKLWDKAENIFGNSMSKAACLFFVGLIIAIMTFATVALTGYEKFLFGKETYSYIVTAVLFVASCVIIPYSAQKLFTHLQIMSKKNKVQSE